MEQNKTRTYLLYAVGEIALVMIGILLALQVNNWNEERKTREAELFLLNSLKDDFELRFEELREFEVARADVVDAIHELNRFINQPRLLPEDAVMDSIIAVTVNALLFNDQFKTLDMLFTTGKINELSNTDLKRLLIKWPQQVEEMMEEQRGRSQEASLYFIPLLYKHVALRSVAEKFDFRNYNLPAGEPVTYTSDYAGLIKEPVLERYLVQLEHYLYVNEIDSKILVANAELIIALLNQEINSN